MIYFGNYGSYGRIVEIGFGMEIEIDTWFDFDYLTI